VIGAFGIDTNVYINQDVIPSEFESQFVENLDNVGLSGGYCAQLFAALGRSVRCIGFCGNDFLGDFMKRRLSGQGIDTEGFFVDESGTKRSVNFVYKDGSRKSFYDGKNSMISLPDVARCTRILGTVGIAHFSIVNWTRYLLDVCSDFGLRMSVDIQDARSVLDDYRSDYLQKAHIIFVSGTNFDDPEKALKEYITIFPGKLFIMGIGKQGVLYHKGDTIIRQPAILEGSTVIDTNGAGDSLAVGFLDGYWIEGLSLDESIRKGQTVARHTCTIRGNTAPFIRREALKKR
jgi:sugar/nucleoside kinase (ribokinase family)